MKINAQIALSLPNTFTRVELKYDTFEKATYDEYLVASIIKNAKTEKDAEKYIDEITGKGSLNAHFKKLYEKESKLEESQINNILNDSLFPVTLVTNHHFKYYDMFNSSVIKINNIKTLYKGDLSENIDKLKEMLMPKSNDVKFLSIDFEKEDGHIVLDNYNASFSEDEIQIELVDDSYMPISQEDFEKVYQNEPIDISEYKGKVKNEVTKGNYKVLTLKEFESICNSRGFVDSENNYALVKRDCIKSYEILHLFGIYFYKENIYQFNDANKERCKEAVKVLIENRSMFNEYPVKSLIILLDIVDEMTAKKVVELFLSRKDSKEMSDYAIKLMRNGLEKNWDKNVLSSIKNSTSEGNYTLLYSIDDSLKFNNEELLHIDFDVLNEIDKMRYKKFKEDRKNLLKDIINMLGTMNTSGIRQRIKKVQKDKAVINFVKFLNNYQGHNEVDFEQKTYEELLKEHEYIKRIYENIYPDMKKRVENAENK